MALLGSRAKYSNTRLFALTYTVIFFIILVAYCFYVFTHVTFVHSHLGVVDVPYYAAISPVLSDWKIYRWGMEHILLLLDAALFFPLLFCLIAITEPRNGLARTLAYVFGIVFIVFAFAKLVLRIIQYVSCDKWPLCINEDPFGDPFVAPISWHFIFWVGLAMPFLLIVELAMMYFVGSAWTAQYLEKQAKNI